MADRNYEDLKAKLGLKPTTPEPEAGAADGAAAAPSQEADADKTPPGGFDLGLERGGTTLDSSLIDVEKAAAAITTEGGDLTVKSSAGIRFLKFILLIVGLAAAFGVGYSVQGTNYDRDIHKRQIDDAVNIKKAISDAKTLGTGAPLNKTVDEHVAAVLAFQQKFEGDLKAPALTD